MMTTRGSGLWSYLLVASVLFLASGTGPHAGLVPLSAHLTGDQEFPPNSSPSTGDAAFILDDTNGILLSAVTFQGLTSPLVSAEIAVGEPGQVGTVIHILDTSSLPANATSGAFTDIWTGLTGQEITVLATGDTYINITTTGFPDGEIRGQIVPEPPSLVLGGVGAIVMLGLVGFCSRRSPAPSR